MSGKQRLKSERIVRSCRSDAWSRSKSAGVAALPMEGEKASHAACLPASSDAGGRTWSKPGASRMSGQQRLKSERVVRSCRSDAWSRSKSAGAAALPMEGEKASHAACLPASCNAGGRTWSKPGASRMSGKQRPKSERVVRSCQSDAWSRSKSAGGAALPVEGEKAAHAACLRASSDAGGRT